MYLFYGTMYYYLVCEFQTSCFSVAREAFRTAESTPASRTRVLPCVAAHRAESSCGACGGQSSHADVGGRVLIVPPRLSRTTAVCATVEAGVGAVWGTLALDSVLQVHPATQIHHSASVIATTAFTATAGGRAAPTAGADSSTMGPRSATGTRTLILGLDC